MTLIKTNFGFHSTADEIISGIDLSGKRAIVTGGASSIGIETVKTLAKAGAEVTIAARNLEAGKNSQMILLRLQETVKYTLLNLT